MTSATSSRLDEAESKSTPPPIPSKRLRGGEGDDAALDLSAAVVIKVNPDRRMPRRETQQGSGGAKQVTSPLEVV
eukprot:CAMPEP_0194716016 /NCGR_PEP_ID=MMETSP0296-20130528/7746_1 /TAXON_ID=39354 /ORGANISM="Heterosigma akashiwo, Strain CCMP2393" /LENGTH=74 /DNA_ID=CAMNT_0039616181 /DNA_START=191 /DNA_END=412 /DNA_ORIENTATION=-